MIGQAMVNAMVSRLKCMFFILISTYGLILYCIVGLQICGYHACPVCGPGLESRHSSSLRKVVYEGHKKYLPTGHAMRDGYLGRAPKPRKASDWHKDWEQSGGEIRPLGMKRFSIFYQLPYWNLLLINSLLDPMHIFKNVAVVLWKTITGAKESKGQREDLQALGRMSNLWPKTNRKGKLVLPKAPWVLNKIEQNQVKKCISEFRTPTGCMHCLKGAFTKDAELTGLKSHDMY